MKEAIFAVNDFGFKQMQLPALKHILTPQILHQRRSWNRWVIQEKHTLKKITFSRESFWTLPSIRCSSINQ